MIRLNVRKNKIDCLERELLTSGSQNVNLCQFHFDTAWDGMTRVAVFRAADTEVSVALDETGRCQVPWEVLQDSNAPLFVGVYGTRDGDIILPTVWVHIGPIHKGVTSGELARDPTPTPYNRVLQQIGDLSALRTGDNASLVAAINSLTDDTGAGMFLTTFTKDDNGLWSTDHTYQEQMAALESGKVLVAYAQRNTGVGFENVYLPFIGIKNEFDGRQMVVTINYGLAFDGGSGILSDYHAVICKHNGFCSVAFGTYAAPQRVSQLTNDSGYVSSSELDTIRLGWDYTTENAVNTMINNFVGDYRDLKTDDKTTLVAAVNEIFGRLAGAGNAATPNIGANGNWYTGDTDTGVAAKGTSVVGAKITEIL